MKTQRVTIDLGTNIDRETSLTKALESLLELFVPSGASKIYRTAPVGLREQPDFFNMVVTGFTSRSPGELRKSFREIEDLLGRDRTGPKYGPRTIDIDLLLYGSVVDSEQKLPHPQTLEQPFVLAPLVELFPAGCHPRTLESWEQILLKLLDGRSLEDAGISLVGGLDLLSLSDRALRRYASPEH